MRIGPCAHVVLPAAGVFALTGFCSGLIAQAPGFSEREVTFRSGTAELHGTLILPAADRPVPVVVFLHGSGAATRAGARPYAEEFAELGVASLFFDKRGTGSSGGSWVTASLDDLVDDALAAVEYVRNQEGIDPERIGLWGVSQAGWVAPAAASRSPDVGFMMLISGGGASPRESEMFSYEQEYERYALSSAEAAEATEILESYFDFLATGDGRADLLERLDGIRDDRLSPLAEHLDEILPSDEIRPSWSWVGAHDPTSHIERVTVPVLLMFGALDTDHPTDLAIRRWREGLARAGNETATLMVFPDAGHGIRMRQREGRPFADGYLEAQLGWLWLHVLQHEESHDGDPSSGGKPDRSERAGGLRLISDAPQPP